MGNRELKFRIWDKTGRKWADKMGFYQDGELGDFSECFHNSAGQNGEYFVAQQYTGLKDKNGREIYEGDLLGQHLNFYSVVMPNYFEVYWNHLSAKFETSVHQNHSKMVAVYPVCASDFFQMEVVGNIFENPDL